MKFETKGVLEIKGNFFVPDYQRGYRWGENEVKQLLDDIDENRKKMRKKEDRIIITYNP